MTNQEIKTEVMDLLNQIVMLTKNLPEHPKDEDDYGEETGYKTSNYINFKDKEELEENGIDLSIFPTSKDLDVSAYLHSVHDYAKRVVKGDTYAATHNETQYYTSNC